jgi:hypothetical protein
MAVFWVAALCSLVDAFFIRAIALMMDEETLVNF